MKYAVEYYFEVNPHEIIKDHMEDESVSTGDSDEKKRPHVSMTLITFATKPEALKFAEYYANNCCHTMLKANRYFDNEKGETEVHSWLTIQDYHLYEGVEVKEVKD